MGGNRHFARSRGCRAKCSGIPGPPHFEDYGTALKEADIGVQRLSIYPLLHVTRALALAGLERLTEAKDAIARAVELGQGVDVAVLEQRILEYSESPPRKAKIQALFSSIDDA